MSAVGGRVEAPTEGDRLLLGPEGANDFRLFAISSRDKSGGPYRDHLAVDSSGTLLILSPTEVNLTQPNTLAVVRTGVRRLAFNPAEVLHPAAMAGLLIRGDDDISDYLRQQYLRMKKNPDVPTIKALWLSAWESASPPDPRLAAMVCRVLNRVIATESAGKFDEAHPEAGLSGTVRQSMPPISEETARLLDKESTNSAQADPERLVRLILQDVYTGLLKLLDPPADLEEPRGLSFTGARPAPPWRLPGRVYLASVVEKDRTRRELRFEIKNPGKDNNPERYKVAFGPVKVEQTAPPQGSNQPGEPQGVFHGAMIIEASGNVRIPGDLNVFNSFKDSGPAGEPGLVLRVQPTGGENNADTNPNALPPLVGQVAPWDLVLADVTATPSGDAKTIVIKGNLNNTGRAPIQAIQVLATAFGTDDSTIEPIRLQVCRGVTVDPGEFTDLDGKKLNTAPNDRIKLTLKDGLSGKKMTVTLKAIGFALPTCSLTRTDRSS